MPLGLALVSWDTVRVGVHRLYTLSPSISRFSIHSTHAIGFQSCFFFTTDVSAPIRLTLHLLTVSSQAWDWLWYPMLWSQRRNMGCASSRNLISNFCSGRSLNLGPRSLMVPNVTTRRRRTPEHVLMIYKTIKGNKECLPIFRQREINKICRKLRLMLIFDVNI